MGRVAQTLIKPRPHDDAMRSARPLRLIRDLGIDGNCHRGAATPRQVLLCETEIIHREGLNAATIRANILTLGMDLHALPSGTLLEIGDAARVRLTHRCEACKVLRRNLTDERTFRRLVGRRGMLAVVERDGDVHIGDEVRVVDTAAFPAVPERVFDRTCWVLQRVPAGHVITYPTLLDVVGAPRTYIRVLPTYLQRAGKLGLATHRVVNSAGDITGHVPGQVAALAAEGVTVASAARWAGDGVYLADA